MAKLRLWCGNEITSWNDEWFTIEVDNELVEDMKVGHEYSEMDTDMQLPAELYKICNDYFQSYLGDQLSDPQSFDNYPEADDYPDGDDDDEYWEAVREVEQELESILTWTVTLGDLSED